MANTKSSKKIVKQKNTARRRHAGSNESTPNIKGKMRRESKQAMMIKLLERSDGASIDEMAEATGWQRHSIRGMISGVLKKRIGLPVTSKKEERGQIYRIVAQDV